MNCTKTQELLKDFVSGGLTANEARQVRTHLASCEGCRSGLSVSECIEILPALDEFVEPSGDFSSRFYSVLEDRRRAGFERSRHPARGKLTSWGWPWRVVTVGITSVLVATGVYLINYRSDLPDHSGVYYDLEVTENLPLLQDMALISNLDLLEDLDAIQNLPPLDKKTATN